MRLPFLLCKVCFIVDLVEKRNIKMDSPEALKNKGYETFGEHFFLFLTCFVNKILPI